MILDLAVNPVPQARPVVRQGRAGPYAFTPRPSALFGEELAWAIRAAGVRHPMSGRLAVEMRLHLRCRSAKRHPDLDNLAKAILDVGNGLLWADDSQVDRLCVELVEWGPAVTGRIEVGIEPLGFTETPPASTESRDNAETRLRTSRRPKREAER